MKIAIICFNLSWQSGGPRLIFSTAQALKAKGHVVKLYAPEFSGKYYKELWQGLDIITVPQAERELLPKERASGFFSWIFGKISRELAASHAAKVIAEAMDVDFDLINVHDFSYPTAYFYKKRNPKAKVLWTENDPPYAYLPKKPLLKDMLAKLYHAWKDISAKKYFKVIDVVSVLDTYNEKWCAKRGLKAHIVRLGVDFEKFYLPVKDFSVRAKEKKVSLFGLGSLNSYRHYEDILLAVVKLREWGYDASARIVSADQWNEKEYREKLLSLIRECKLENAVNISFEGVSEAELMRTYEQSDFFVYPMYVPPPRDGFGFSIGVFEAMAAGLPVVLCRTTTSTEVLEDGKNAVFVDPKSPDQIAERIKEIFEQPRRYKTIAEAGQNLVERELMWKGYVEHFLELF